MGSEGLLIVLPDREVLGVERGVPRDAAVGVAGAVLDDMSAGPDEILDLASSTADNLVRSQHLRILRADESLAANVLGRKKLCSVGGPSTATTVSKSMTRMRVSVDPLLTGPLCQDGLPGAVTGEHEGHLFGLLYGRISAHHALDGVFICGGIPGPTTRLCHAASVVGSAPVGERIEESVLSRLWLVWALVDTLKGNGWRNTVLSAGEGRLLYGSLVESDQAERIWVDNVWVDSVCKWVGSVWVDSVWIEKRIWVERVGIGKSIRVESVWVESIWVKSTQVVSAPLGLLQVELLLHLVGLNGAALREIKLMLDHQHLRMS